MNKKTSKTLEKVERMLNMSNDVLNDLNIDESTDEEKTLVLTTPDSDIQPIPEQTTALATTDPEQDERLFELQELKGTFQLVKRNVQRLVDRGMGMMDQTVGMDVDDMKASEIAAFAELSNVTSNQLKMLVELYKDIISIEKDVKAMKSPAAAAMANLPEGASLTQNTTNVVIQGTTNDVLKQLMDAEGNKNG